VYARTREPERFRQPLESSNAMNTKPTHEDKAADEQGQTSSDVNSTPASDVAKAAAAAPIARDKSGGAIGKGAFGQFAIGE
jgi:hypothetical protein